MSFFGEIDNITILEENAKEVLSLEEEEARKLLGVFSKVRGELLERIRRFQDQFTGQQARVALIQIDQATLALRERLGDTLSGSVERMLRTSIRHLTTEIDAFSEYFQGARQLLPFNAIRVALDEKTLLLNQYQTSLDTYSDDFRQRISRGLLEMMLRRDPPDRFVESIGKFWAMEEWRVRRVVRTELHNVHGRGKLAGMQAVRDEFLPELKKTLYHPKDHRTGDDSLWLIDNPLVVEVDRPFRYEWPRGSGKWRVFASPPDRPNDRAIVIPYQASWD